MSDTHFAYAVRVPRVGPDTGIYWSGSASGARYMAWMQFRDVYDTRRYTFRDFLADSRVRRAREWDGAFTGRQGLLPEFVARRSA